MGGRSRLAGGSIREHRRIHATRRRQGLRRVQIWVPDTRSPWFAQAAHDQSLAVAHSAEADDDQAFIDAITGDDAEDDV